MKGIERFFDIVRLASGATAVAILLLCAYEPRLKAPDIWEDSETAIMLLAIAGIPLILAIGLLAHTVCTPKGRKLRFPACSLLVFSMVFIMRETISDMSQHIDELYWYFGCSPNLLPIPSNKGPLTYALLSCLVTCAVAWYAASKPSKENRPKR